MIEITSPTRRKRVASDLPPVEAMAACRSPSRNPSIDVGLRRPADAKSGAPGSPPHGIPEQLRHAGCARWPLNSELYHSRLERRRGKAENGRRAALAADTPSGALEDPEHVAALDVLEVHAHRVG